MRSFAFPASSSTPADTCFVWLPGAYQNAQDFLSAGFHTSVANRDLAIDLVFVDPELQHVGDRRFRKELENEVLLPARACGRRSVWLAGISWGGFMALDHAVRHAAELAGLCLLAPYLGNRMLTQEISRALSLRAWQAGTLADGDEERRIWRFIQDLPVGSKWLHLGYGRTDRFVAAHRLMAQSLPESAVDEIAGGHDWATWTLLWENFLDSRFA